MPNSKETWKVGELAERTGLTIRTLHHYDAVGLLSPSGRTESLHGSGHRLYTAADVARLHQILSLKQLGFTLEQIGEYLTREDYDPRQVIRLHLEKIRRQAVELDRLGNRLQALVETLDGADAVSVETFLETIEAITMVEKYYSPEQLEQLKARKEQVGDERIKQVQAEWPKLMDEVRAAMAAGVPPSDPKAQELARRWMGLVNEFTGGDPGLAKSLGNMYANENNIHGMDVQAMRPMFEYIQKATGG
ncbi:MAG TPA: MerR family transcriptional regulator [Gemmata sp.]|nr:MerR family transcriptional regulator [Gemmata sp.]